MVLRNGGFGAATDSTGGVSAQSLMSRAVVFS
jgi:hypothetical protein